MGFSYISVVFIGFYTLNNSFLNWVPNHNVYTWALMHLMLNLNAFFTILVLAPPKLKLASRKAVSGSDHESSKTSLTTHYGS